MVVKCHGYNPILRMTIEIGSGDLYLRFLCQTVVKKSILLSLFGKTMDLSAHF